MANMFGPYQIRAELGRGAMARVWRAYDSVLDREVAIKEPLLPHGVDSTIATEYAARFVREGRAAAKLSHPGIVTIYAADIYEGHAALVMELVEGETLGQVLSRGPLHPEQAVTILEQLLSAVGYAHQRGIVHRDIKPDNVFVGPDGQAKLADFGIASLATDSTLTQAGTIMGTPGYMAPEQITGEAVDARADLFAIGVLGYEMLTGKNPFGASEGLPTTTIMYRIVHQEPMEIPSEALASLPLDLRPVLATALAKDPNRRFPDAKSFLAALRGEAPVSALVPVHATAAGVSGMSPADGGAGRLTEGGIGGAGAQGGTIFSRAAGSVRSSRVLRSWVPYTVVLVAGIIVVAILLFLARTGETGNSSAAVTSTTVPTATGDAPATGAPVAGAVATTAAVNHPPTADAGVSQTVVSRASVRLDGTRSSDPDGTALIYQWNQTAGPTVMLTGADTSIPSFTAPNGPATLTFELVVSDGAISSSSDSVMVTVQAPVTTTLPPMTDDDWGGVDGWTVIIRGDLPGSDPDSESEARRIARVVGDSLGIMTGVLYSSNYSSLRPGYWVVFTGYFTSAAQAAPTQAWLKGQGYSDAYVREIAR